MSWSPQHERGDLAAPGKPDPGQERHAGVRGAAGTGRIRCGGRPVAKHYLGTITAEQLLAASGRTDSKVKSDQRCAVAFYPRGGAMVTKQTKVGIARFQEARNGCPHSWTECEGAVAEIGRLSADAVMT